MYFDITTLEEVEKREDHCIVLYDKKADLSVLNHKFNSSNVKDIMENSSIRYEDHLKYEVICVLNNLCADKKDNQVIHIIVEKENIHFIGNIQYLKVFVDNLRETMKDRKKGIGLILHQFLLNVVNDYHRVTDQIESEISLLEDEILEDISEEKEYSKRILHYRKKLLLRKRHYEQILDVIDYLLDNNNDIYTELEISRFNILKDRVNRMLSQIISMLEYVTEVREAYQSAVDAKQNKIMSLFTVITSIFLPLTLIAGWYGMNLKMPEFGYDYAYPIVSLVSVIIVAFCIYYFKKKKWF